MASIPLPPIERIRQLLDYDKESGWLIWRDRSIDQFPSFRSWAAFQGAWAGKRAGCFAPNGYRKIRIDYKLYQEHRIVWAYVNGVDPFDQIDHINLNRSDNRITNLRIANNSEQGCNKIGWVNRTSPYKGAFPSGHNGRWTSKIEINGKKIYLGCFASAKDAHEAYCQKAKELHGEFFNPGKAKPS